MPQRWQWSRNAAGEEPYTITFHNDGYLRWNDQKNYGWWSYIYSAELDVGYFIIEFTAGKGLPRRHVFQQIADDKAILLPRDHGVYTQEQLWHSKKSIAHSNTETIELYKAACGAKRA